MTSNTQQHDVVVVGAGIIGLCSALFLQESGARVTLIDPELPGQKTSYGNAGVISPWSCVPQSMPGIWKTIPGLLLKRDGPARIKPSSMMRYAPWLLQFLKQSSVANAEKNSSAMFQLCGDSVHLYKRLLEGTGQNNLLKDSLQIHAFRNADALNPKSLGYTLRSEKGAVVHVLNKAQLRDLEPALSPSFNAAIAMPDMARAVNPGRLGEVLAKKFLAQGGHLIQESVLAIKRMDSGWQIQCQDHSISCQKVVLAAGAWSGKLLEPLGVKVPLAAERGYHLWFEDTGIQINHSVMDVDAHVIASSMESGIRVAGMAEFGDTDSPSNKACVRTVRKVAANMVPGLAGVPARDWMGVRSSFPDSLPVIEEATNYPGLIMAFGHNHYGLMMAPKTGQLVTQLVKGEHPNIDMSVYRSNRF